MDLISDLLNDPAAPRLTTYTEAGRMELSGITLANWQAKVANLLTSIGVGEGDTVAIAAAPGWQPACIAVGAWKVGASISDANSGQPAVLFTDSLELAEGFEDSPAGASVQEIYLLSADPFGRGVEEAGGDVPFGINDFSPELRVHPDAFMGSAPQSPSSDVDVVRAAAEQLEAEHGITRGARVVMGPWDDVLGLARCLSPLLIGGSVVMSTDSNSARLEELKDTEKADVIA